MTAAGRPLAAARPEAALEVVFACWKEKDAALFRSKLAGKD